MLNKRLQIYRKRIVNALKGEGKVRLAADLSLDLGINKRPIYNWKKNCAGLNGDKSKRLKELGRENRSYAENILDSYLFESMLHLRTLTEELVEEYNHLHPHQLLSNKGPIKYLQKNTHI
jgi:hypothetical protein